MGLLSKLQNAADFSIGLFSPRRRMIRHHLARMESDEDYRSTIFAAMRARGYRAASDGKYGTPFLGSQNTADQEVLGDLPSLYSKSRELNRDDPLASGLTWTFVRNVIGTGIRAQARTQDPEKNKRLEEVWAERRDALSPADDMTHAESQRMIFWKTLEDGNVFVKRTKTAPGEPVWFETIEKHRVQTPTALVTDPLIRDGVVKDKYGRIKGYWTIKTDDSNSIATLKPESFAFVPYEEMCHLRLATRPGQTHGVPLFHAVTKDLRDLDLLMLAALKRVQVSACLAAFITSPKGIDDIFDVTANEYGYKLDQSLEPGMIFRLFPDEQVSTLVPNFPNSEFEPFIVLLARRIGAALGVSWQIVLKDFSQSTYSSARTDLLEARQAFKQYQSWFIDKFLAWQWVSVMEDARLRGDRRLAGCTAADLVAVHWIPNGWDWIDPDSEANAVEKQLALRITTLREECAARGKDWEEVITQSIAEEKRIRELREAAGLPAEGEEGMVDAAGPATEDEARKMKIEVARGKADAYGIAVRAGVITPQPSDEEAMRAEMELPPPSPAVGTAWKDDGGVRRPITLQVKSEGGEPVSPLAKGGPPKPKEDAQDAGTE